MRLLHVEGCGELSLTDDLHDDIPPYAILSHTWGADHEEVTFESLCDESSRNRAGYTKLQFCEQQAKKDNLEYFWVDTCCINKSNHAELSEALNSMFRWYQNAEKCYVYFSDVSARKRQHDGLAERTWESAFRASRWFTRGWTLQELLAPISVEFFSKEGQFLGSKDMLDVLIQDVTGIPTLALRGTPLAEFSIPERMRWTAKRDTKRVEDKVYCLLGIFGVFMNPIYGEGENAWIRLRDEIAKSYRCQLDGIGQPSTSLTSSVSTNTVIEPRIDMLASLCFDSMDSRGSTIKSAYSNTCKWLFEHPAYLAWMDPKKLENHNGFLWINGKPGAGKSTLVKFALMHAERERIEGEIVISFFFNARGDELEKSTIGMYRALLFQLLKKAPDLQNVCDDLYSHSGQSNTWTIKSLCETFSSAIAKLRDRRLRCFIDAVDECDEQQIQDMVIFFEELGQIALIGGREVFICFASRHYPTIDIRKGCQLTLEDECGHSEDLAKYVRKHLRAGKGKYIEEIRKHIQEKANGVFMWVILVVEILNKEFRNGRIFAVRKRLKEIPAKLGDLFKDILRRDCTNMRDLLLCLQWILFARRPLRRDEFYFAMMAGLDPEPDNVSEWDPKNVTLDSLNRFVLSSSKGLAELTRSKVPTVQFIHESVRDFLIKEGGLCELWSGLAQNLYSASHEQLKQCCRNYLTANSPSCALADSTLPKASSDAAKDLRQQLAVKLPFLEYASQHVLYHANEAASEIPQDKFLRDFDLKTWLKISNQLERFEVRRHTLEASLVYLLAEQNLARLIGTAKRCGYTLYRQGERFQFPLFIAMANGHRAAIGTILQEDRNPFVEEIVSKLEIGRHISIRRDQTPLLWALEKKHPDLAEAIVTSSGEGISLLDYQNRDALAVAAAEGFERVMNPALTLRSIDINAADKFGRTALLYGAQQGRVALIQQLLQRGADIEARDKTGRTALIWAARNGERAMVHLLIEQGANIEARDKTGRTALIWAARNSERATVHLLIKQGANIDAKDETGRTALIWTARNGERATVHLLIEQGVDIEAKCEDGCTALIWATRYNREAVVELLIKRGAGIEVKDNTGCTALVWAARYGEGVVVQLLIEQGANVGAKCKDGSTALQWAAYKGRDTVIPLLIERGADIEVQDKDGRTALFYACEAGDERTVRLLLALNARTDTIDKTGKTALLAVMKTSERYFVAAEGGGHVLQDYQLQLMLLEQQNKKRLLMKRELLRQQGHEQAELLSSNRVEIIQLLLANGAQPDIIGDDGKTALALASERGWRNVVQLLVEWRTEKERT